MRVEEQIHGVMEVGKQPAPALTQMGRNKARQAGEVSQVCCAMQLDERNMTQMKFQKILKPGW